jgi:hypothetical protein
MKVFEKISHDNPDNWDEVVPLVCMAYRITPNASTGESPYRMNFGRDMTLRDETAEKSIFAPDIQSYVQQLYLELDKIWKDCHEEILDSQRQYKHQHDKQVNKGQTNIVMGSLVFVMARTGLSSRAFHPKMEPLFSKLYRVVDINDYNLTLNEINKPRGKECFVHRDMVKLYLGNVEEYLSYVTGRREKMLDLADTCQVCF